jgi:hypothetical protein
VPVVAGAIRPRRGREILLILRGDGGEVRHPAGRDVARRFVQLHHHHIGRARAGGEREQESRLDVRGRHLDVDVDIRVTLFKIGYERPHALGGDVPAPGGDVAAKVLRVGEPWRDRSVSSMRRRDPPGRSDASRDPTRISTIPHPEHAAGDRRELTRYNSTVRPDVLES